MRLTVPGLRPRHPSGLAPGSPAALRRRRTMWLGAVGVAVVLVAALFSFGLSRDPTLIRSPLIGRPAPRFTLPTVDGGEAVDLARFRGQVVVVNFLASWCRDCRVEHPALLAAWQRYRDSGVVFLGIAFQDRARDARAFFRGLGGDWPLLTDPGSRTAIAYGVYGIPETFFIARDGRVAAKHIGAVPYEKLTDEITRLLEAPAR